MVAPVPMATIIDAGAVDYRSRSTSSCRASTAFIVDIVLSAAVTMVTRPKPASELVGLVYCETPRELRTDPNEASYPWYRRTLPLAGVALVMVIILNANF